MRFGFLVLALVAFMQFQNVCALPLEMPMKWAEEIETRVEMSYTPGATLLGLLEIHNKSLREDCGVDSDTIEQLESITDVFSVVKQMFNGPLSHDDVAVIKYLTTRDVCARDKELVGTPVYDILTLSPRLPDDDPCYAVLAEEPIVNFFVYGVGTKWTDERYTPCVIRYLATQQLMKVVK